MSAFLDIFINLCIVFNKMAITRFLTSLPHYFQLNSDNL